MIQFSYADTLDTTPALKSAMFQDRRRQFKERQNWDVSVNDAGEERDEYDDLNPLYVIALDARGGHAGSMRFLPTVGRTMVNEHFSHLSDGVHIIHPLIWECTRFCISPDNGNPGNTAAALMLAGCEMGLRFGLQHSVGVFDARMTRIYRRIGWSPEILGTEGTGREAISVGLWEYSEAVKLRLCSKFRISPREVEGWFDKSFPLDAPAQCAVAA